MLQALVVFHETIKLNPSRANILPLITISCKKNNPPRIEEDYFNVRRVLIEQEDDF